MAHPSAGDVAANDLRRRWRYYRTERGHDPVRTYLESLSTADRNAVRAQMNLASRRLRPTERVRGDLFAVSARRSGRDHQVLFAFEGAKKQVLLALDAFALTTARTPPVRVKAAQQRLALWRSRPARRPGSVVLPPTRTLDFGR